MKRKIIIYVSILVFLFSSISASALYENRGVFDFVSRLYETVLHRSYDEIGMNDWYQRLVSGQETGAQVAYGFFFSKEYTDQNVSNDTYVQDLYQALFNRKPDEIGYADWMTKLDMGVPRLNVFKGFVDSKEFEQLCHTYNIIKGTVDADPHGYDGYHIDRFVRRLYQTTLCREADEIGLASWKEALSTHRSTGADIVYGFIFSPEFLNRNLNNEDYVKTLYQAFFDREGDPSGLEGWIKLLNEGESREYVFAGFVNSMEFEQLCVNYGIERGSWSYHRIDPSKPMVALTFDDGPSIYTTRILDALERHGQTATFFVVGYNASRYVDVMKRAYDMGCEIGNHSNTHANLARLSYGGIVSEMDACNAHIIKATGKPAPVSRTPGGSYNSTVCSAIRTPIIMWSIDTLDWKTRDTNATVSSVLNNVQDGDIVLMHDIHYPTIRAAEILIPELVARGYQLVTVSELAMYRSSGMQAGQVYSGF